MPKHVPALLVGVFALAVLGTSGCQDLIRLDSARFQPGISTPELAGYKGKAVVMRKFENVDDSTTQVSYRGNGRRYGGPVLASYFWNCFREGFERLGVSVYDEASAPVGVQAAILDVRLVRIDESAYQVTVGLQGGSTAAVFRKPYSVAGPRATTSDSAALRARAYDMMNALFVAMVRDAEFKAAFTGGG
jgi:hypothetical protein